MNPTKIPFSTQIAGGYDQTQVDSYLQKLTDEYGNLHSAYLELTEKYDQLAGKQSDANMQAISKALVDAEVRALQIIEDAKTEASRVTGQAYVELGRIRQEKDRAIVEVNDILSRLKALISENTADV